MGLPECQNVSFYSLNSSVICIFLCVYFCLMTNTTNQAKLNPLTFIIEVLQFYNGHFNLEYFYTKSIAYL